MTRGDGSTFDTDAHYEWGYVVEDWPTHGVTSFIALESEFSARNLTTGSVRPVKLAKRAIGHAEVVT
jgi:hypothetical protein